MIDLSVLPSRLPPISTLQGKVQLERANKSHGEVFSRAAKDASASVQPWLGKTLCPSSLRQAQQTLMSFEQLRQQGQGIFYLLMYEETCLGLGFINHLNHSHCVANMGYWLTPSSRGQGLAKALVASLQKLAFSQIGIKRLELYIEPENKNSIYLAERMGAVKEGLCRQRIFGRDAFLYSVVQS